MEGIMGLSDLELNQEKLIVVKDEYRRLCYEMRKKEMMRNSTHTKMHQHIKHQWEIISELRRQKSELTLQLRFQEADSFSNKCNQNLEHFMKSLDEVIRLEGHIKKQVDDIGTCKRDTIELDKKIRQKQREMVKTQRTQGRVLKYQKNISFLENRLNGSLHRYNQLLVSNNALREDISSLLLTLSSFRRKYTNIKRLLASGRKTLTEIVNSAAASYQTGESVKFKLNLIKDRTGIDQRKLGEKIKELKILMEQDKQFKEFLDFKMKDRSTSSESDEASLNEQIMQHRIQTCDGTLSRIQQAAGCQDVGGICKTYLQQEESNLNLFEKVNDLSLEIERLNEEVREQRRDLLAVTQQYTEQKRKDFAAKQDIENMTEQLRTDSQMLEDASDEKAEELESVKAVLQKIYSALDRVSTQQISFTVDEGITDDNILQYLEALERRIIDLIRCDKLADMKEICYIADE